LAKKTIRDNDPAIFISRQVSDSWRILGNGGRLVGTSRTACGKGGHGESKKSCLHN
jgi:hypothetical protein